MADYAYGTEALTPGASVRGASYRPNQGTKRVSLYPNPYLDIASTYYPSDIKKLFDLCRFYALSNPLIATVLYKMSSYPVTEIIYRTSNPGLRERYRSLFEDQLRMRSFLVEVNLDRTAYGNAFVSVAFPFKKYLRCKQCRKVTRVDRTKYVFKNYQFHVTCGCGYDGPAEARDMYEEAADKIRLVRWNPENLKIVYNEITGERAYFFELPKQVKNDILAAVPSVVETTPQTFLDALREKKQVRVKPEHVFHIRRPTVSRENPAWGSPLLAQVLKQVFYLQVLQKAQETIFFGYITPMRVFYPAPTPGGAAPYSTVNLGEWREHVASEIREHRKDGLYIPIMPIPLGYQNVGGEGKALMLANEIRVWSELIVTGLGFPPELIFSGLSYSGSNISLRMLENEFLGNREDMLGLVRWIRDQIAAHMRWPKVALKFKPFKMADDLQRSAFSLQLVQQKMMSLRTLLESLDYDYEQEKDRVEKELNRELQLQRRTQEFGAETQGRTQVTMAKYQVQSQEILQAAQQAQMEAQGLGPDGQPLQPEAGTEGGQPPTQFQMPPSPGAQGPKPAVGPGGIVGLSSPLTIPRVQQGMAGGMDIRGMAHKLAQRLRGMPEAEQGRLIGQLKMQSPDLYGLVLQYLNSPEPAQPLPQQRPPRRGPEAALV